MIPQVQVSRIARLRIPRVPRVRALDYQGSGVPSFQGSRFQTCMCLGLTHQQRNDRSNAKQTLNTMELLQFIGRTQCEQSDPQ